MYNVVKEKLNEEDQMRQLMERLGVDVETISADRVTIEAEGDKYVFCDTKVNKMRRDKETVFQINAKPEGGDSELGSEGTGTEDEIVNQDDVELVAERTGKSKDEVEDILGSVGDVTEAVARLLD